MDSAARSTMWGTLAAIGAFVIWGLLPIYWKQVVAASSLEILAHRIVWSAVLLVPLVAIFQRRELRSAIADLRAIAVAAVAGVILGGNWFLYVHAVTTNNVVQASLGYYINPLVNVFLGVVVLREQLSRLQVVALLLAAVGVVILTVSYGVVPWVSLGLAFSFGIYGLVKKTGRLNAIISLLVEIAVLFPAAIVYLIVAAGRATAAFGAGDPRVTLLLVGAGLVTVAPLLLFSTSVRRIALSRVGFLQYVGPTLMLLIGTLGYHEAFAIGHVVAFSFIWIALALYSVSMARRPPAAAR